MAGIRTTLEQIQTNVDESMGMRTIDMRPTLSPLASKKDIGRRPNRSFGKIEVDLVVPDPGQPRSEFSDESIERLAASIQEKGQLHPIRVRWSVDAQKWFIISGERRWRATKAAGLRTIDCFFQESDLTESEILEQQLVENLLREDLSPLEQARAFDSLMKLNGWNGRQVAQAIRVHPSKVSRALSLLELPQEVQAKVEAKELPASSAYELSKLGNAEVQRKLAGEAVNRQLSRDQAASAVRKRRGKSKGQSRGVRQVFFADNDWKVTVTCPHKGSYHDMQLALEQALEEVQYYIDQGRKIHG